MRLRVDKRRFERVMANLIENANLYAGGVTRVVVERHPPAPVGAGPDGGSDEADHPDDANTARSIRVIVEDRGPGVPLLERHHLFERFYRGSRAGQREASEGTGLGLSLVAEHVRLHGGAVWIDDAPGGGSRFIVELPLLPSGGGEWDPL
jgi:signal transduction histidine kinase